MAKTISRNQPTYSATTNLNVPVIDFKSRYATAKDESNAVDLTSLDVGLDVPAHVRYSIQNINNVYRQSDISAENRLPATKGVSLMAGRDEVWTVTDTDDVSYRKDFPVSGHLVLKIPQNGFVTEGDIKAFLGDLLGNLGFSDTDPNGFIANLLRGALNPRDI